MHFFLLIKKYINKKVILMKNFFLLKFEEQLSTLKRIHNNLVVYSLDEINDIHMTSLSAW